MMMVERRAAAQANVKRKLQRACRNDHSECRRKYKSTLFQILKRKIFKAKLPVNRYTKRFLKMRTNEISEILILVSTDCSKTFKFHNSACVGRATKRHQLSGTDTHTNILQKNTKTREKAMNLVRKIRLKNMIVWVFPLVFFFSFRKKKKIKTSLPLDMV